MGHMILITKVGTENAKIVSITLINCVIARRGSLPECAVCIDYPQFLRSARRRVACPPPGPCVVGLSSPSPSTQHTTTYQHGVRHPLRHLHNTQQHINTVCGQIWDGKTMWGNMSRVEKLLEGICPGWKNYWWGYVWGGKTTGGDMSGVEKLLAGICPGGENCMENTRNRWVLNIPVAQVDFDRGKDWWQSQTMFIYSH